MNGFRSSLFALTFFAALHGCASQAFKPTTETTPARFVASTPGNLRGEIFSRRSRVPEFKFLKEWANARRPGLRIWMAGGSAAGFAHYVKADLERETQKASTGSSKYFDSRFQYSYYQIFRSTQDADIVIDGTEQEASDLEWELHQRFGYLQGSKSTWEVRLLRASRGSGAGLKEPLIQNSNFLNQNSDSHSTGMIELTDPPTGESVVRDLFQWENQSSPAFLDDVMKGELHFYFNPLHETTARARAGLNPPILSVIRYFTKAFQYGLTIRAEDKKTVQGIIDRFQPGDLRGSPAASGIQNNSRKLFSHAADLERAYLTLKSVGLLPKLIEFAELSGNTNLALWLNRAPLLTDPLGKSGKTAAEIFGKNSIIISHETNDMLAYESITRSREGYPNVFISRVDTEGEAAIHGAGFYTKLGTDGARDTGLTIRFELDPQAREGSDFAYIPEKEYVIVKNRKALRVVNETGKLDPVAYFRFVSDQNLKASDLGVWKMIETQIQHDLHTLTPAQTREIVNMALESLRGGENIGWITKALWPVQDLRKALEKEAKSASRTDFVRAGALFWGYSEIHVYENHRKRKDTPEIFEMLKTLGAFDETTKKLPEIFEEGLRQSTFDSSGSIRFSPILPEWKSATSAIDEFITISNLLQGEKETFNLLHALTARELWSVFSYAVKARRSVLSVEYGNAIAFMENELSLRKSEIPGDIIKNFDSNLSVYPLGARLSIAPISPELRANLLKTHWNGWSEHSPLEASFILALKNAKGTSFFNEIVDLSLELAEKGLMNGNEQRPTFLQILFPHYKDMNSANQEKLRAASKNTFERLYTESTSYFADREYQFLGRYFGTPELFDVKAFEGIRTGYRTKNHSANVQKLLGSIYVEGYGKIPYFKNRWDLINEAFNSDGLNFNNWLISSDQGLKAIAQDFHAQISKKIQTELPRVYYHNGLIKAWRSMGCGKLVLPDLEKK